MTKIINGKEIALEMQKKIAEKVQKIKKEKHIIPTIAVILVGNDKASEIYVGNKEKSAHNAGMNSIQIKLDESISQKELIAEINKLNNDHNIDAILVQLPLPKHIKTEVIINTISPQKDVDGFHPINAGKLAIGKIIGKDKAVVPCTPMGCMYLIKKFSGNNLSGLKTLVIGTSNIVGRPMAQLLVYENCTVAIANSKTKDLRYECLQADIIISATGVPGLIKGDMIKDGAIIIDVGINRIINKDGSTKIVGDVDFGSCFKKAKAITPVPGGVGPMTIACLLENAFNLCLRRRI